MKHNETVDPHAELGVTTLTGALIKKDTIKKLHLDQNKSLAQTMKAMNEQYSFDAS